LAFAIKKKNSGRKKHKKRSQPTAIAVHGIQFPNVKSALNHFGAGHLHNQIRQSLSGGVEPDRAFAAAILYAKRAGIVDPVTLERLQEA